MLVLNVINQKYQVIAVGIVQAVTAETEIPDDKVPVSIYSVEECGIGCLQSGQVVIWPKCLLLNPPTITTPSPEQKEDRKTGMYNYMTYTLLHTEHFEKYLF